MDCGANSLEAGVTLDFALVRDARVGLEAVAVDEQVLRCGLQGRNGAVHRQIRRLQNVDRINFFWARYAYRPMPFGQEVFQGTTQVVALGFAEFFGVGEPLQGLPFRPKHRSSYHRAGEASSAGLVHPR